MIKMNDVYMNDVNSLVSDFLDLISNRIEDYPEASSKEDDLFQDIQRALEKFFNYPDYKNYN